MISGLTGFKKSLYSIKGHSCGKFRAANLVKPVKPEDTPALFMWAEADIQTNTHSLCECLLVSHTATVLGTLQREVIQTDTEATLKAKGKAITRFFCS